MPRPPVPGLFSFPDVTAQYRLAGGGSGQETAAPTATVSDTAAESEPSVPEAEWQPLAPTASDDGERVAEEGYVQGLLVESGYPPVGGVDGYYGSRTAEAVMQFQIDHGLPPTGVVDLQTLEALELAASGADGGAPSSTAGQAETAGPGDGAAPAGSTEVAPWIVEEGDNLWSVSERTLEEAWGRPPSDAEVADYWHDVVALNMSQGGLSSGDPNLIYPGEVVALPPVPHDPLAAPPQPSPANEVETAPDQDTDAATASTPGDEPSLAEFDRELLGVLDALGNAEVFHAIDANEDERVDRDELQHVVDNPDGFSQDAVTTAQYLLDHPVVANFVDTGAGKGEVDGRISLDDTAGARAAVENGEHYALMLDTAAGRGERDGHVSERDVDAALADGSGVPPQLRDMLRLLQAASPGGGNPDLDGLAPELFTAEALQTASNLIDSPAYGDLPSWDRQRIAQAVLAYPEVAARLIQEIRETIESEEFQALGDEGLRQSERLAELIEQITG